MADVSNGSSGGAFQKPQKPPRIVSTNIVPPQLRNVDTDSFRDNIVPSAESSEQMYRISREEVNNPITESRGSSPGMYASRVSEVSPENVPHMPLERASNPSIPHNVDSMNNARRAAPPNTGIAGIVRNSSEDYEQKQFNIPARGKVDNPIYEATPSVTHAPVPEERYLNLENIASMKEENTMVNSQNSPYAYNGQPQQGVMTQETYAPNSVIEPVPAPVHAPVPVTEEPAKPVTPYGVDILSTATAVKNDNICSGCVKADVCSMQSKVYQIVRDIMSMDASGLEMEVAGAAIPLRRSNTLDVRINCTKKYTLPSAIKGI